MGKVQPSNASTSRHPVILPPTIKSREVILDECIHPTNYDIVPEGTEVSLLEQERPRRQG